MPIQITSGPARVLSQGMVTAFLGSPLRLEVEVEGELSLGVSLDFTHDPSVSDVAVETSRDEDGSLALVLVNFDTADGRGSAEPVLLAEHGDDLFFFHFRVFLFGRTPDRTVHYTFYRVARDAVAWEPG